MKILQVIPSLNKGGAERLVIDITNKLLSLGHEVKLVCLNKKNTYAFATDLIDYEVVKTAVVLSLWRRNKIDVSQLQQVIDLFQPDVIHSHLFEAEINLAFCKIPANCRRVVHFHDNMIQMATFSFETLKSKSAIANFYERCFVLKNLPKKSIAIGISNNSFTYISKVIPNRIKKTLLLNAIDTDRFVMSKEMKRTNEIVTIGSFVEKKGHRLAIETMAVLKSRNVQAHLTIIGDGVLRRELEELILELNLSEEITLEGIVDYPETYLQKAKLYLHTASYEPLGLVLIEAMACGTPVVSTDCPSGPSEILEGGRWGKLVPLNDSDSLSRAISDTLVDGRNDDGQKERANDFRTDSSVAKYLEIV